MDLKMFWQNSIYSTIGQKFSVKSGMEKKIKNIVVQTGSEFGPLLAVNFKNDAIVAILHFEKSTNTNFLTWLLEQQFWINKI